MSIGSPNYHIVDESIPARDRNFWYYAEFKCQPDWPQDKTIRRRTVAITANSKVRSEELIKTKLARLHPFAIKVGRRHG